MTLPLPDPNAFEADQIAGWYGKLPSLGDFAQRRVKPDFIEPWDQWLAHGMAYWQTSAPETWESQYLNGASWRFVLLPDVWPDQQQLQIGVIIPSFDSVGRRFPLTLVQQLPKWPQCKVHAAALLQWLQQLSDVGQDALERQWSVVRLEAELQLLGPALQSFQGLDSADLDPPWNARQCGNGLLELHRASQGNQTFDGDYITTDSALWLGNDQHGVPVSHLFTGPPRPEHLRLLMCTA